jgi:hypothetical protein
MRLKAVKDDFIDLTLALVTKLDACQCTTHAYVIRFQLRDDILAQTPSAEANTIAEVTDPTSIIFAHIKVIIVAQFEACMAELSVAAILRLL